MTDSVRKEDSRRFLVKDAIDGDNSVVFLSSAKITNLLLFLGDIVLLKGCKGDEIVCIVLTNDLCFNDHIEMNLKIRNNLRVCCGEYVSIEACENIQDGKSMHVLPIDDNLLGQSDDLMEVYLKPYFNEKHRPVREGDTFSVCSDMKLVEFKVTETEPAPYCLVTPNTMVHYEHEYFNEIRYDHIGGLEDVKKEINGFIHGILLYGLPGCGKTMLAKAIANEYQANFIWIKCPELCIVRSDKMKDKIYEIFNKARRFAPCLLFLDNFESLSGSPIGSEIIQQILNELDNLDASANVFVIGATNRPDTLDRAILQSGRLNRHIYPPLPNQQARLEILKISVKNCPVSSDIDMNVLANVIKGFIGADLVELSQHTCRIAIRESIEKEQDSPSEIRQEVFKFARRSINDIDMLKYELVQII